MSLPRFFAFAYSDFYPSGGLNDFFGAYETAEEAWAALYGADYCAENKSVHKLTDEGEFVDVPCPSHLVPKPPPRVPLSPEMKAYADGLEVMMAQDHCFLSAILALPPPTGARAIITDIKDEAL